MSASVPPPAMRNCMNEEYRALLERSKPENVARLLQSLRRRLNVVTSPLYAARLRRDGYPNLGTDDGLRYLVTCCS